MRVCVTALLLLVFVPSTLLAQASAQASIAGAVRDASGAVLPGVSVETSSPPLIEKVRSVTTDGAGQYRIVDVGSAAEIVFTTSGGLGEAEVGGPVMSIVPRTGGNTLRGSFYANGSSSALQGGNITPELRDAGLTEPGSLRRLWDVNGSFGGPLARDRAWYYLTSRYQGNRKYATNMFYNRNAGDPARWTYEADERRATNDGTWKNTSLRLTLQATAKNTFNIYWDEQTIRIDHLGGGTPTTSPEAAATGDAVPLRTRQITWRSPVTSRVLLEGGYSINGSRWGGRERDQTYVGGRFVDGNATRSLIRVVEQAGSIPNLTYRSINWNSNAAWSNRWRGSASYVTGAHSLKAGYEGTYLVNNLKAFTNDERLTYRFNNGTPNQLTMTGAPFETRTRTGMHAAFIQDQSTFGRLTVQGALRFDYAYSRFKDQQVGPERFIPVAIVVPAQDGVLGFKDLSPRLGAAYDLTGDGRTTIKVNWGRYLEPAANGGRDTATNPLSRIVTSTTRSWTDSNRNYVADCNLLDAAAQNLAASGGDVCGPWDNRNFGSSVISTTLDPALLEGWGVRPNDGQFGVSVQRALWSRSSVEVGYHRRWFGNFDVTDNLLVGPADYDSYSLTVPSDSRLPDGGSYVIQDLSNIKPERFGQSSNRVVAADTFGTQEQYWQGVDVNVNARLASGLTLQGGTSTGRQVTDNCEVIPDDPSRRNCRVTEPWLTQVNGLASYTVPKADVQVSGTFQSRPGGSLAANWVVPTAVVAQTLGRPLAGGAANVTINILNPWQMRHDRVNQVDLRVAKVIRAGRTRTTVGIDIFNAFNSSAVLARQQSYSPTSRAWLTPTDVIDARFAKISQIDF